MKRAILPVLSFLLIACGGGGSGGGGGQQASSFGLESSRPTDQENNVERDIVLEAQFNSPVSQASIDSSSVLLEDNRMTEVESSLSVSSDNHLVSLTPSNLLAIYGSYHLLLDTAIEDEQSNTLGRDFAFTFKTRDGRWDNQTVLDATTNEPLYHQLARNGQGDKVAVWSEFVGSDVILKASDNDIVDGWSAAQTISGFSDSATQPVIALNHSGSAIVLFRHLVSSQLTSASVWAAHYSPTGGWSSPKPIIESLVKDAPEVILYDNGDALALFRVYDATEGHWDVASSSYSATTGDWSAIDIISKAPPGMSAYHLQLVTNHNGRTLAMWSQNSAIWVSRFENEEWGGTRMLATGSVGEGQLNVNSQGVVLASWVDWQSNALYTSEFNGSQWSAAAEAPLQPSLDYDYSIAMNNEHAYLVWANADQLWASRFLNLSTWEQAQAVGNTTNVHGNYAIRVDNNNNALLVWEEELPNDQYSVWSQRYLFDNGWQAPLRLDNNAIEAEQPRLVLDADSGEATVLWTEEAMGQSYTIIREFE